MYQLSEGARRLNLEFVPMGGTDYELYKVFTTFNGSWDHTPELFSIGVDDAKTYGVPSFMERGAATHILVRIEDEGGNSIRDNILVSTNDLTLDLDTGDKSSGWQNAFVPNKYNPETEHGPWSVSLKGADYKVTGLGLPYGWHVSTFIVFRKVNKVVTPDPVPTVDVREIVIDKPTTLRIKATVPFNIEIGG